MTVGRFTAIGLAMLAMAMAGCEKVAAPAPSSSSSQAAAPVASQTSHFNLLSTASQAQTSEAGSAAEALLEAYVEFFDLAGDPRLDDARFQLRLYGSRNEFVANNRSRPWAEAYYRAGTCHAYVDASKPNPYNMLMHEVVHQLNRELAGWAKEKWINEGLATYFGSSLYIDGRLTLGQPDPTAYPVLWLKRWELSGDWATDVQAQRVIPLEALITGQGGPPLDATVNAHYLAYWSLTHFLLHHEGGKYAQGYRQLVQHGGSLAAFEENIGPLAVIEGEWYAYLLARVRAAH